MASRQPVQPGAEPEEPDLHKKIQSENFQVKVKGRFQEPLLPDIRQRIEAD